MAFDSTKYKDDYARENYDRVTFKIPKGKKALLQKVAQERNVTDNKGLVSVSRLIVEAIEQTYNLDLSKPD